jgi:glycosyltransferase involved in cell wall biosynthesis
MRIAYLLNQYPKISHSFIRREILALERQGFEVVRIALRGWDAKVVDAEDEQERKATRYVLQEGALPLLLAVARMVLLRPRALFAAFLLAWRMGWRAERPLPVHLVYLAEACRIVPWLEAAGVAHLHVHFGTNPAEVAMLARVLGGPSFSFTVHGPEEFDKWQFIGLAEKIRRASFVVAISSYARSQLYRCVEHTHWGKVRVVHCGVEPSFCAAPIKPPPVARRLVCVGRLCEQKGQLLLVEAARRLKALGSAFELVLVGDGELRFEIEALVDQHRLRDCVRITGAISSDRLRDEVLGARALVLPSFAEGLPGVIMEAMALRRPVISTYVAGTPELVQAGEHGWLVPAGDVAALVDAMMQCLDAPVETIARMGAAAHSRVVERHSVDAEVKKLARLFEDVGNESAASASISESHQINRFDVQKLSGPQQVETPARSAQA